MKVSSVDEMRNLDRTAIENYGIADHLLMENAGIGSYLVLANNFSINNKFAIVCGLGNNGGDGFVVARKLHSNGGFPTIYLLGDPQKYKGSARLNLDIISKLPIPVKRIDSPDSLKNEIDQSDVIVDAIFGTGLDRDIGGIYKETIEIINESTKPVVSIDIPSGIHGDSGHIMGVAVKADYTVTFGLPKFGNLLFPGYDHCGQLYVTHISFPPILYEAENLKVETNEVIILPPRNPDGHKGSFGDVLFIGGASAYFGAPYFAALSFLKSGGGYSRLAVPKSMTPFIANKGSEIVFVPQLETANGSISLENKDSLLDLAAKVDMVILGPGLSLDEETQKLAVALAAKISKPLLIDGDGITGICKNLDVLKNRKQPTILTPHLGEMARITCKTIEEINNNKIGILQNTCKKYNIYIVLKGAHTLIGYPDQKVFINLTGNSGMASAGSGDVLTGTIAAMFGLGFPIAEAVRAGVYVHGLAGDLAAIDTGCDGMTAQTILENLPNSIRTYREEQDALDKTYSIEVIN